MVIFGLLLLILGVLGILSGVFGTDYDTVEGKNQLTTEFLGINCGPEVIFLLGVASAVLVLAGLWFMKVGAKQGWKRRKEQKRLTELSEKLDEVDLERRREELSGRDEDS